MTDERQHKFIAYGPSRTYGIGFTIEEALGYCKEALGDVEGAKARVVKVDARATLNWTGDIDTPEGGKKPEEVGRLSI